jgi:hypothetical protein
MDFIPDQIRAIISTVTAASFDQARAEFERAWRAFSAKRTPADHQAWSDERDWTARKHACRRRRLPMQYINDRPYPDPARAARSW